AGLYVREPPGVASPAAWGSSLHQTVALMLRPILASGVIAAAPVWALGAMILPWLVRRRSLPVAFVLVTVWSATLVAASTAAINAVHPASKALAPGTAIAGAVVGGAVALAPTILATWHAARAGPRLP